MGFPKLWTDDQRQAAADRLVMLKKFDLHAPADVVLRLLEQGEITRSKARESLRAIAFNQYAPELPLAKLNWSDAAPSAPPERPNGERRGYLCPGSALCEHPMHGDMSPPAQAATEVTHEQARTALSLCDGHGADIVYRYIDQQTRRDAAAQADHAARLNRAVSDAIKRGHDNGLETAAAMVWAAVEGREYNTTNENLRKQLAKVGPAAQVTQAAPRVEGGTLQELACKFYGCHNTPPHWPGCPVLLALLENVASEARAAALPAEAAEALRDWYALDEASKRYTWNAMLAPGCRIPRNLLYALAATGKDDAACTDPMCARSRPWYDHTASKLCAKCAATGKGA